MRDGARRRPGAVADDVAGPDGSADGRLAADVGRGADTDGDGRPDTLLAPDGVDLLVLSDLDGDGLADRVLRIGPDAAVHTGGVGLQAGVGPPDPLDRVPGSAPAHGLWVELLGRLFGSARG